MGPLVQAGLVMSLEPYDDLYRWSDEISEGALGSSRMSDDGKTMGAGTLYGLPYAGQLNGIYYNRAKVEALGIDTNFESMADLTAALKTATDAGETAVMLGNLDGDPAKSAWEQLLGSFVDKQLMRDVVQGKPGTNLVTDEAAASVALIQDWANKGYFYEGYAGTSRADGDALFAKGVGVFDINNTQLLGSYAAGLGSDLGFTLVPREKAGDAAQASGATAQPFCISSKSKSPDVAASFLNFVAQPDNAQTLWDGGLIPLLGADSVSSELPVENDVLKAWQTVSDADGLTWYLGWATTSFQSVEMPNLQEVLAGRMQPKAFLESLQANWAETYGN